MVVGTRVEGGRVRLCLCVKLVINIYFLNTECCVLLHIRKKLEQQCALHE